VASTTPGSALVPSNSSAIASTPRLIGLTVAVERPHQLRLAERQVVCVSGLAVVATRVPGVPGLAVAVQVPVRLLVLGKGVEKRLGDDVLDPNQVGLDGVAVENGAAATDPGSPGGSNGEPPSASAARPWRSEVRRRRCRNHSVESCPERGARLQGRPPQRTPFACRGVGISPLVDLPDLPFACSSCSTSWSLEYRSREAAIRRRNQMIARVSRSVPGSERGN
jgi:hypothetical protein